MDARDASRLALVVPASMGAERIDAARELIRRPGGHGPLR